MKEIEKIFNYRFKFKPMTLGMSHEVSIIEFLDTQDGTVYKIETYTGVSIETILENIIKDKRDSKLNKILL